MAGATANALAMLVRLALFLPSIQSSFQSSTSPQPFDHPHQPNLSNMASPSTPGQGEKRRHDGDAPAESSGSPSKKQRGVESQEETLADVIKADRDTILGFLERAKALEKPVGVFLLESCSSHTICRARFCIPGEIRKRKYIESSYHFMRKAIGHPKYFHVSCFEQMFDLAELQKLAQQGDFTLQPSNSLNRPVSFPPQIVDWHTNLVTGQRPPCYLSEVLAEMFYEHHIDGASLGFLQYLRGSVDDALGSSDVIFDKPFEGLSNKPLQQLTLSQFKTRLAPLITNPVREDMLPSDRTLSEQRHKMRLTVTDVIKAASRNVVKGAARDDSGIGLSEGGVPKEGEKEKAE
jgi:hypothetical protein